MKQALGTKALYSPQGCRMLHLGIEGLQGLMSALPLTHQTVPCLCHSHDLQGNEVKKVPGRQKPEFRVARLFLQALTGEGSIAYRRRKVPGFFFSRQFP